MGVFVRIVCDAWLVCCELPVPAGCYGPGCVLIIVDMCVIGGSCVGGLHSSAVFLSVIGVGGLFSVFPLPGGSEVRRLPLLLCVIIPHALFAYGFIGAVWDGLRGVRPQCAGG